MALSVLHANANDGIGSPVAVSCPSTTAGNLLILLVAFENGTGTTPVLGVPTGWVSCGAGLSGTTYAYGVWKYENNPGGITSVSVSCTNMGFGGRLAVFLYEVAGAATSASQDQYATQRTSSTNPSISITTTYAAEIIFGLFAAPNVTVPPTAGTGYTMQLNPNGAGSRGSYGAEYEIVSSTGTYAVNATGSTPNTWGTIAVSFKAASPSGTANPPAVRVLVTQPAPASGGNVAPPPAQGVKAGQPAPLASGTFVAAAQGVLVGQYGLGGATAAPRAQGVLIGQRAVAVTGGHAVQAQGVLTGQPPPIAAGHVAFVQPQGVKVGQLVPVNVFLTALAVDSSVGIPSLAQAEQVTLRAVPSRAGVGVPTLSQAIVGQALVADTAVGHPTITGGGQAVLLRAVVADTAVGQPALAQSIQLQAVAENGVGPDDQDLPWTPRDLVGVPTVSNASQAVQLRVVRSAGEIGRPFLLDAGLLSSPPPPGGSLIQELLNANEPPNGPQAYFQSLEVEDHAYDQIWTRAESDGSDTLEWKVPAESYGILRGLRPTGSAITHPITGVMYTIRVSKQTHDAGGQMIYYYLSEAPHYQLGREPAIPFASGPDGTTLAEVLSCLDGAARNKGWTIGGSECVGFAGPVACPFIEGPQFSSGRASVLTQLFQVSQTWGGVWRFDEANRVATLSCQIGGGSGITADWRQNMAACERTVTDKPQSEVLITENANGVMSGVSAAIMLSELQAQDACDQYTAALAQQAAQNNPSDPCKLGTGVQVVNSRETKAKRDYAYEQFLLTQVPQVSYAATVIDVSMLPGGRPYGRIELGEWVTVVDGGVGISDVVRCVRAVYNILEPEKSQYEFGNEIPWMNLSFNAPPVPPKSDQTTTRDVTGANPERCLDESALQRKWEPPPTCGTAPDTLLIALQDAEAQYANLKFYADRIENELLAMLGYVTVADAYNKLIHPGSNPLRLDDLTFSIYELLGKINLAINTAEAGLLNAREAAIDGGALVAHWSGTAAAPSAFLGTAGKPSTEQNGAILNARTSIENIDQGKWHWDVLQYQVGDACNPANIDTLGETAARLADKACAVQQRASATSVVPCGDMETGSGDPGADALNAAYSSLKTAVDHIKVLTAQWENIVKADQIQKRLVQKVKTCVAAKLQSFAATSSEYVAPIGPGVEPFGQGQDASTPAAPPAVAKAETTPPRGPGSTPAPATENCIDHASSVAYSILHLSGVVQRSLGSVDGLVASIFAMQAAAAAALPSSGGDDPNDVTPPPAWDFDEAQFHSQVSDLRGPAAYLAGDATNIIQDLSSWQNGALTPVAAGGSDKVLSANPANSITVLGAKQKLALTQATREALNQHASNTQADMVPFENAYQVLSANLGSLITGIQDWAVLVGAAFYDPPDPIFAALDQLTDAPDTTSKLYQARDDIASVERLLRNATISLLDGVDCADGYLVAAGVDLNQQRAVSVLAQNVPVIDTPAVDSNPDKLSAVDSGYTRSAADGHIVQRISVRDTPPTNPNKWDIWIDTSGTGF